MAAFVPRRDRVPVEVDVGIGEAPFLILPALGVKASYYKSLATYFSKNGYHVVSMDWRGLGHSSVRASRKVNFGYKDFINDIDEVVTWIHQKLPHSKKITLFGHSLGGQLSCLYNLKFPNKTTGVIAIASCLVHHKGWTGKDKFPLLMAGLLFQPIATLLGYFPGQQLGFGDREFRSVIHDWVFNLKTGKYILKGDDFDYEATMPSATFPMLAISVENDFLAPYQAVENLLAKYPDCEKQHLIIPNSDNQLNHFRWTKTPKIIGKMLEKYLFF